MRALASRTNSVNESKQKFASIIIEKIIAFGGQDDLYPVDSHCEVSILQEFAMFVPQDKCQVHIHDKAVKYLIHNLILLPEHNHHEALNEHKDHEVSPRG